jgi:hypothetical protein
MYNKIVSTAYTKPTKIVSDSTLKNIAYGINLISRNKASLIIPGNNHCLFGPKEPNTISTLFRSRILPIKGNVFAIGDIHGSLEKLVQLLTKLNLSKGDILVFLGDYIDRGQQSKQVIDYLGELQKVVPCVYFGGNHEYMYLHNDPYWIINGGDKTLLSYGANVQFRNITKESLDTDFMLPPYLAGKIWTSLSGFNLATTQETTIKTQADFNLFVSVINKHGGQYGGYLANHVFDSPREIPFNTHEKFFRGLRDNAFTQGWRKNYFFSHAGIDPKNPQDKNKQIGITMERDYMLKSGYKGDFKIILGHTSVVKSNLDCFDYWLSLNRQHQDYQPFDTPGYTDIDTGAFLDHGALTAMLINGDNESFIQAY